MSDLIPRKTHPKDYDPVDLNDINFECSLSYMLKSMMKNESTKTTNWIIKNLIDNVMNIVSIKKCLNLYHHFYTYQTQMDIYPSGSVFKKIIHEVFYNNNILQSSDQLDYICANTRSQSESKDWYNERAIRVSASTAHAIKTRRSKFDELADSMTLEKK